MTKCQWIDGDPLQPGWDYCGKPVMQPGMAWCREHYERVYQFERNAANTARAPAPKKDAA
jgi:hypothetical protein